MTDAAPTRRSFLALLGLAPIAAPAAVAASTRPTAIRFAAANGSLRTAGRRILLADEVDPLPWSAADVTAYRQSRLITWPDGPEKDEVDREWAAFMRTRIARIDAAREAVRSSFAPCPILIDDAGGGP